MKTPAHKFTALEILAGTKVQMGKSDPIMDYRDATTQPTATLSTLLQAFEKNNGLSNSQFHSIKKTVDLCLHGIDKQSIKSTDSPPLARTEKIKAMEIEL